MKTVGKRIISWVLAGIIALALIPFMSQTVRADGETPIALDDCTVVGYDSTMRCDICYINIGDVDPIIRLTDFDEASEEFMEEDFMVTGLFNTGYTDTTNIVNLSDGYGLTLEEFEEFYSPLDETLSEGLDFSNLYGIWYMDEEYDNHIILIQGKHIDTNTNVETPFTYDIGTVVSFEEDAYHFDDGWMQFTADLYTLVVPFETTEINLSFDAARIAYGYDEGGYCICGCAPTKDGNYADIMSGELTSIVKVDDDYLLPNYVHVQTPYIVEDGNWISDTLYVIQIVVEHQPSVWVGNQKLTDFIRTEDGYSGMGNYFVGIVSVPLYTVYLPKGTDSVTIKVATGSLIYNYDSEGNWLSPWYDNDVAYGGPGVTSLDVKVDHNGDGEFDYIQIQKVYTASYGEGDLLCAITFSSDEKPAPAPADKEIAYEFGDEYEILTQARAGTLTDENAKHYFESILAKVIKKGSAKLDDSEPNNNAKVVLALTAAGYDARNVAGYNLLEPLCNLEYAKGSYCTAAAYSLLALSAHRNYAEETESAREALVAYLLDELGEDGTITYNWGEQEIVSVDATAMLLQALRPYVEDLSEEDSQKIIKGGEAVMDAQTISGGFTATGNKEDGESTSTTSEAILTLTEYIINQGADDMMPETVAAITFLESVKTDDGFAESLNGKTDAYATKEANLAITAYTRMQNDQTSFFDLNDVDLDTKPIQASGDGVLYVETDDPEDGIDKDYILTYEEIEIPSDLSKEPNNVIKLYEITILDENEEPVEIKDTPMTIKLKIVKDLPKFDTYKVVFVKDGKIAETMEATVDGEYLVFKTTHLSEYGVVGENNPAAEEKTSPETGDSANTTLYLILAILSAMAIAGAVTAKVRKKEDR